MENSPKNCSVNFRTTSDTRKKFEAIQKHLNQMNGVALSKTQTFEYLVEKFYKKYVD